MAGNFWKSSHYQQWLLTKQDLLRERQADLKVLSEDEYQKIMILFTNFMQALGEQVRVRQQVIATGIVYFKRFYARNSLKSIDPLLMAPTCVYLASKVEEFGVISNTRFMNTCTQVLKSRFNHAFPNQEFPYKINNILECEFYLLEMMDCCLIVYHPYRSLPNLVKDIANGGPNDDELLKFSWKIINDSLKTDTPLLYPPYIISLSAICLAGIILQKDLKQWFAELSVDMDTIGACTTDISNLYNFIKKYDEREEIAAVLAKMPKPNPIPSRPPSQGAGSQEVPAIQGSQNPQGHS